jgi:thioredoxin 1
MENIQKIPIIDQYLREGTIAVIDFYGNNCPTCRMLAPLFDSLSQQYGEKMSFAKINIDDHMNVANQLGIKSVPTLIFFKDGREMERHVGVLSRGAFQKKIETLI